jgi:gamma-glutamylcyclotransferase (GGCT)/AIG2-like uncharacterized protein YtfP
MKEYLFVYGTLRSGFDLKLKSRVKTNLQYVGRGKVAASMYDIGKYPGAIQNKTGGEIIGDVFLLNDPPRVLKILDKYEGISKKAAAHDEFIRQKKQIQLRSGKKLNAWVYWYNQSVEGKLRIKYKDYLNYIKKKAASKFA